MAPLFYINPWRKVRNKSALIVIAVNCEIVYQFTRLYTATVLSRRTSGLLEDPDFGVMPNKKSTCQCGTSRYYLLNAAIDIVVWHQPGIQQIHHDVSFAH